MGTTIPEFDEPLDERPLITPRYLSPSQASVYLGIAETLVRRYIRDGFLPASQFTKGGRILVRRDDLDALWDANRLDRTEAATA